LIKEKDSEGSRENVFDAICLSSRVYNTVENNMSEHVLVVSLYVDKTVILAGLRKYSIFI